jgi:AcrR family transcriptional regulator
VANEEVKAANLQMVLKTAYELFKKYGINQVTKEQISRESGLSRRTIDRYFSGKKDCVLQTMEMYLSDIDMEIESKFSQKMFMDGERAAVDLLEQYMVEIKKIFMKNVRHFAFYTEFRLYVYRNCKRGDKGYELLVDQSGDGNLCQKIFMLGQMDGTLRMCYDIESEDEYFRESFIGYLSMLALSVDAFTKAELESRVDKRIRNTMALYRVNEEDYEANCTVRDLRNVTVKQATPIGFVAEAPNF